MNPALPYARLSGFYFFYYAVVGAFMPYWGLWLQWRGQTPSEIGIVFATMSATRLVMPVLWGWYADRLPARMPLVRAACVASALLFMVIPLRPGFGWLVAFSVAYTIFWNAILPQFEVVTLHHLHNHPHGYSRIRVWGSVGFVAAVFGLGPLLDRAGIGLLPWLVAAPFLVMAVNALWVPEPPAIPHGAEASEGFMQALHKPEVIALMLACLLTQLSFAPYYSFFSLYLEKHGYSRSATGLLWGLGVVAEIVVLLLMGQLLPRFGPRRLMLFAIGSTALRWALMVMVVDSLPLLVLVQLLHFSSFGMYHATAMDYIRRFFPGRLQGRGQAFYNSVSYGIGGAVGSLGSGYLWERGSADAVFWTAALVAAAGCWVAARRLRSG